MRIVGSQMPNAALPAVPAFVLPQPIVLPKPDLPAHPVRNKEETALEFRMRKSAFMAEKHGKKN
jgi:hypothetical protein